MDLAMETKTALIAGGSSGIGLATAELLLKEGANVVIVGNNPVESEAANKKLSGLPPDKLHVINTDLSKPQACLAAVNETLQIFSRLDILINSAGIYFEKSLEETTETEYDQIIDVNVKATFFMCQAAIPYLEKQISASIVNVSSDAGINGNYFCTAYCASKGAITVFTKALALELALKKIRVNCVCPGDVKTPMLQRELAKVKNPDKYLQDLVSHYPLERLAEPEEIANVIAFLASDKASFVTGAAWSVDGGITAY
jgi:NAD(P)-dependent dehydrogenase (short-subunit alcohol dehydrogenase family)